LGVEQRGETVTQQAIVFDNEDLNSLGHGRTAPVVKDPQVLVKEGQKVPHGDSSFGMIRQN
jgi:hypothetical protein